LYLGPIGSAGLLARREPELRLFLTHGVGANGADKLRQQASLNSAEGLSPPQPRQSGRSTTCGGCLAGWEADLWRLVQDPQPTGSETCLAGRHGSQQIVAVGSRSLERAQSFAAQYGIPRAVGSPEDLVGLDEVEIVYIATLNPNHRRIAELALGAGKHVLIEK